MRVVQATLHQKTLAEELADLALRGSFSEPLKKWVKDELTNTSVL